MFRRPKWKKTYVISRICCLVSSFFVIRAHFAEYARILRSHRSERHSLGLDLLDKYDEAEHKSSSKPDVHSVVVFDGAVCRTFRLYELIYSEYRLDCYINHISTRRIPVFATDERAFILLCVLVQRPLNASSEIY